MKNTALSYAFIALCATALIVLPLGASARIKCWTNKEGVRECGNVVPPEYAQQGHSEISDRGLVIKETARAKTPEELEKERAEKARLAAETAKRERLARQQAERDRILLDTFATEDDLELARGGKLQAIESRIRHAQALVSKLEGTREKMLAEAARLERSGEPIPDDLRRDIRAIRRQIGENRSFIKARRREQEEVQAKFDADLERYRELRGSVTAP